MDAPQNWTGDAAYHQELAAGRLAGQARKAYGWMLEAVAANGAEPVTTAEALKGRASNVNLYWARYTELFYQGAIVRAPVRKCKVTGREALTWRPVPPPWVPVPGSRTSAVVLRPLLREAAALIRELTAAMDPHTTVGWVGREALIERAEARAHEYEVNAGNTYVGSGVS